MVNPRNVLLSHLKGEWAASTLWAYGERTLNVFGEKLMNGERWANAVRKVNDERTVNAMWTLCERKMNALIRVPWGYPNIVFRR